MGRLRAWLVAVFVAALLLGGSAEAHGYGPFAAAGAAQSGQVSVYAGPVRQGINGRVACSFLDGANNNRGEIIDRQIIVTDPLNREYYRSDPIPELANYAVRQMTCLRSAQTGYLVVTTGGFESNQGTSQALSLATQYFIRQPITYEEYAAGKR